MCTSYASKGTIFTELNNKRQVHNISVYHKEEQE